VQPNRTRLIVYVFVGLVLLTVGLYGPSVWSSYQDRKMRNMSEAALQTLLKTDPGNVNARYYLGLAYARANRFREATREFLAVLEKQPARADVLNDLGVTYLLQERYYESLVALQGALTVKSDFAAAMANLGRLHLATEMPYTAARELKRAVELDANNADIWCDYGEANLRTLNYNTAVTAYQRGLRLRPNYVRAHVGLGRIYHNMGRYAEAEKELKAALQIAPDDPSALRALGRMWIDKATSDAELREALQLVKRASASDPNDPDSLYDQGRIMMRLDKPKEAIELFKRTIRVSPQHAGAIHQMERALRAIGRTAEANRAAKVFREMSLREREETRLEERISRVPEDWDARVRLAELYIRSGKRGKAVNICFQLKNSKPDHPRLPILIKMLNPPTAQPVPPALLQGGR